MKKGLTDITILLDRSGSMEFRVDDTIGGFNGFIKDQRKLDDNALVTLIQFDDQYEPNYEAAPLARAGDLSAETYEPRGSTALLYAMKRAITRTGERLKLMPDAERPEKVIFVVITDGQENASQLIEPEISKGEINALVTQQRDVYKWLFIFLGTNQNAIAEAGALGFAHSTSAYYGAGKVGTRSAYLVGSDKVRAARATNIGATQMGQAAAFTDDDRAKLKDES